MQQYLLTLRKAKKTFPMHKRLYIRLKEHPSNPFRSLYIAKFIQNSEYPDYELYIHDMCFTIKSLNLSNFESISIPIDDKLWIEFFCTFDFIKVIKNKKEDK